MWARLARPRNMRIWRMGRARSICLGDTGVNLGQGHASAFLRRDGPEHLNPRRCAGWCRGPAPENTRAVST